MPDLVFLSYTHHDASSVAALAGSLRERGVRPWRDRDSLPTGTMTRPEIHRVLNDECNGAMLWLSPHALRSDYVMHAELPTIVELAEAGDFMFTPIFDGITPTEATRRVRELTGKEIGGYNGIVAANYLDTRSLVDAAARRYLTRLLDRARVSGGRPLIRAVTRNDTAGSRREAHVNLDWREAYRLGVPDPATQNRLKHALGDTASALLATYGPGAVNLDAKTHLSVAVALGYALREPSGAVPRVLAGDARWAPRHSPIENHECLIETRGSDGPVGSRLVAVEVAVTRDISQGIDLANANGAVPYAQRRRFTPAGGPARDAVTDERQANGWAEQIVTGLSALKLEYRADAVHLFLACPLPLAVLIGWRLNATGPITIFEWFDGAGPYVPGWNIP